MTDAVAVPGLFLVDPSSGVCCYPLPVADRFTVGGVDGPEARTVPCSGARGWVWVLVDEPVDAVWRHTSRMSVQFGYVLSDRKEESERWPLRLDVAEAAKLDRDDLYEHYVAEYGPKIEEAERVDVSGWATLEGKPDAYSDVNGWVADEPAASIYGPAFHHVLPGVLTGFRGRLIAALRPEIERNGGDLWDHKSPRLAGNVRVRFEPPVVTEERSRRGRASQREQWMTRKFDYGPHKVPEGVRGVSKANAVELTAVRVAEWVDEIMDPGIRACGHCKGRGWVEADR